MSDPFAGHMYGSHPFGFATHISDVLREAAARCDWRKLRAIYQQCSQRATERAHPVLLQRMRAFLAQALGEIASSYDTRPADLALHALAEFADIDGFESLDAATFATIYLDEGFACPSDSGDGRRIPSPFEATVETCRRLRDTNAIGLAMSGTGTSGILCGSMNYGPFYGVRGNVNGQPASDLDLVVASAPDTDLADIGHRLSGVTGIAADDVDRFVRRGAVFTRRYDDGRTTFSHKFAMWAGSRDDRLLFGSGIDARYLVSVHIVPPRVLEFVLVESSTTLVEETAGRQRPIRDYRDRASDRNDKLYGFDGRPYVLDSQPSPAELGVLRRTCAYHIDDTGHYHPGFYQIITQPRLNLRWDEARVHSRFDQFRRKLADRLAFERQRDPYRVMLPSFAHLRLGLFAPHVIQRLDSDYSPN